MMETFINFGLVILLTISVPHLTEAVCTSTGPSCVRDCAGQLDGDYQSCDGCGMYVTCSGGFMYEDRPCPPSANGLFWDDIVKRCEYTTETCEECYECDTGPGCVTDCTNMADGDYQSCTMCNKYVSCSGGILYDERPCPAELVWNDGLKRCDWTSSTCTPCPP